MRRRHECKKRRRERKVEVTPNLPDSLHLLPKTYVQGENVRRPDGVESHRVMVIREIMNGRRIAHNMRHILAGLDEPIIAEGIRLTDRIAHGHHNIIRPFHVGIQPELGIDVTKVIDDRSLQEHVGIYQDNNVMIMSGLTGVLAVSERRLEPMLGTEWFVPVLRILPVLLGLAILVKMERWCEMDVEFGRHDGNLLLELGLQSLLLGLSATGDDPRDGSRLLDMLRLEEKQIRLPILLIPAAAGEDHVVPLTRSLSGTILWRQMR